MMSKSAYADVVATANALIAIKAARQQERSAIVREVGMKLEARLDELAVPMREELQTRMEEYRRIGRPPSLLRIIGQSHLEKPFNRILKWSADVEAEHGFGRDFLRELAWLADLPELAEDLAAGGKIVVTGETAIDDSGNMPDLVVQTERAALMLENKVNARESGDQYAPYLCWFAGIAAGRQSRALLCSRDLREKPSGWDGWISHAQLAGIFERLARLKSIPLWGRVIAWQCATAFEDQTPDNRIIEAQQLLSAIATGRITAQQFRRLRELQAIPSPTVAWPTYDSL